MADFDFAVSDSASLRPKGGCKKDPQATIVSFWSKFLAKNPSKVNCIFPPSLYEDLLPRISSSSSPKTSRNVSESYVTAVRECKDRVAKIIKECHRTNEKFLDPEFDIESDFEFDRWNCLKGLLSEEEDERPPGGVGTEELQDALNTVLRCRLLGDGVDTVPLNLRVLQRILQKPVDSLKRRPGSVHRVDWIYDKPQFTLHGYDVSDIRQASGGDCWWLVAVANLCGVEGVLDRICVARDEKCGVYGFVFFRDGEWISTVVDDNLYLKVPDFAGGYDPRGTESRKHKERLQTGSDALYFASCLNQNETWLPLLEKAYAKVHGDYDAIDRGFPVEAVEDMTGGVGTIILTNKILDEECLWKEMLNENKEFLFAVSSKRQQYVLDVLKPGLVPEHAYSILRAREEKDKDGETVRLVQIRNPWGKRSFFGSGDWDGPWSDGSAEWNVYWIEKLNHTFGNHGVFWMRFEDMLKEFPHVHRTRLFSSEWHVTQAWTKVPVPWVSGYQKPKFGIIIAKRCPVVVVLSQLDTRYFIGLGGQYIFKLCFQLRKSNVSDGEYIAQARGDMDIRSVSAEVELEEGEYDVFPEILAIRDSSRPLVEEVVKKYADCNPDKLRQIGKNHDIANAKGLEPQDIENMAEMQKEAAKEAEEADLPKKKKHAEKKEKEEENAKGPSGSKAVEDKAEAKSDDPAEKPVASTHPDSKIAETTIEGSSTAQFSALLFSDEAGDIGAGAEGKTKETAIEHSDEKVEEAKPKESENDKPLDDDDDSDLIETSWNAVCIIGLRVYSMSADTRINIIIPKDIEDASL